MPRRGIYAPKGYDYTGDAMKSDLSAFLDDELEAYRQPAILAAVGDDEELRKVWDSYHLIGDALRRSGRLDRDLVSRVMLSLEQEPVILAPQAKRAGHLRRSSLALAATAAGAAVVAWIALNPYSPRPQLQTMALAKIQPQVAAEQPSGRMQEYLVAHQIYSPRNLIQGGTSYVRTVSATRDYAAK